jgi:hypothetical protein
MIERAFRLQRVDYIPDINSSGKVGSEVDLLNTVHL